MNAISRPSAVRSYDPIPDAHSDAQTELARHLVDLRIHALVMLLSAALAAFSGFRLCDVTNVSSSVETAFFAMPCDVLSFAALAVFIGISALCLFEAHRCWRRAAITAIHAAAKTHAARGESVVRRFAGADLTHLAGLFSRIRLL